MSQSDLRMLARCPGRRAGSAPRAAARCERGWAHRSRLDLSYGRFRQHADALHMALSNWQ